MLCAVLSGCGGSSEDAGNGGAVATPPAYPDGPYGTAEGDTIDDLSLPGWGDPVGEGYDVTKIAEVKLGDFYDPDGTHGIRLLIVNSCTIWCGPCRERYSTFSAKFAPYAAQGVALVGSLTERLPGEPAGQGDVAAWAETYAVDFPFALDAASVLHAFALSSTDTRTDVIVSPRDMRIVARVGLGPNGNQDLWSVIDEQLAAR